MNHIDQVQEKKHQIEDSKIRQVKFDHEKKNLTRRILKHVTLIMEQKAFIEFWTKEFLVMLSLVGVVKLIHERFIYLRELRDINRQRLGITLFAFMTVKKAVDSKGGSLQERIHADSLA